MEKVKKPKVGKIKKISEPPLIQLLQSISSTSFLDEEKKLPVIFHLTVFHSIPLTQMRFKKKSDIQDFFVKAGGNFEIEIQGKKYSGIVLSTEYDLEDGYAVFIKFSLEIDYEISYLNEKKIEDSFLKEGWKKRKTGHKIRHKSGIIKMK